MKPDDIEACGPKLRQALLSKIKFVRPFTPEELIQFSKAVIDLRNDCTKDWYEKVRKHMGCTDRARKHIVAFCS
jgi:hypothetical protein